MIGDGRRGSKEDNFIKAYHFGANCLFSFPSEEVSVKSFNLEGHKFYLSAIMKCKIGSVLVRKRAKIKCVEWTSFFCSTFILPFLIFNLLDYYSFIFVSFWCILGGFKEKTFFTFNRVLPSCNLCWLYCFIFQLFVPFLYL